ncbi:MAG: hypothetical protein NPIRA01_27580 [Nitrospirales bacterium]|nr:MAG: hypothetical protein NPIRA01_27580 [Nitrospirales bacterium]
MLTWLTRFIEHHHKLHQMALLMWRQFPPRLAGILKGLLARKWVVGAIAVMIDENTSPPEVLLVEHSYRPQHPWGLPGGSLESTPGNPSKPSQTPLPDNVIESALDREIWEELGIDITVTRLLKIDAIPYVPEEPGPYRLHFYFRCVPQDGFLALRQNLESGRMKPRSPEIKRIRLIPLTDLNQYEVFSTDVKFLSEDLPRLEPSLQW